MKNQKSKNRNNVVTNIKNNYLLLLLGIVFIIAVTYTITYLN